MRIKIFWAFIAAAFLCAVGIQASKVAESSPPLGLPPVPHPEDNPLTTDKIALGDKLFHDKRFSSTGDVSCATCHDKEMAFTDSPLQVSEGIEGLTGTRNAPTVVNAAYFTTQFDAQSIDLYGVASQLSTIEKWQEKKKD